MACFLTSLCPSGSFPLPWDSLNSMPCSLHGGEFYWEHLLWNSPESSEQREESLNQGSETWEEDLECREHSGLDPLSWFLSKIQPTLWIGNVEEVSGD